MAYLESKLKKKKNSLKRINSNINKKLVKVKNDKLTRHEGKPVAA